MTSSHFDEISYAVIAALPGLQPDREIVLLTAHSGPDIHAAVDYMTKPQLMRELVQKIGLKPGQAKYYQVLLRVIVDKGDRVKSEYVTHHLAPHSS